MGCDIHLYVEKLEDGSWKSADKWMPIPEDEREDYRDLTETIEYGTRLYNGRNYALFAVLGNVRNYWRIKPIDEPRGLPVDCSPQVRTESDYWDSDGHSHSWFTLEELQSFDWTQKVPSRTETLAECAGLFLTEALPALQALGEPDKIRIVFWFDN